MRGILRHVDAFRWFDMLCTMLTSISHVVCIRRMIWNRGREWFDRNFDKVAIVGGIALFSMCFRRVIFQQVATCSTLLA